MILVSMYNEHGHFMTKGEVEYSPADFPLVIIFQREIFYLIPGSNASYVKAPTATILPKQTKQ